MSNNSHITKFNVAQANDNAPTFKTTSFRRSDLQKILQGRYGGPCRTADAERYLVAAIPMLAPTARSWRLAVTWARQWTPELLEQHGEEWVQERWLEITNRKRPNLTSDQLARLLQVADDEPEMFKLRCIPAMSKTKKIRAAERKVRKAECEAARRARAPGHTPRSQSQEALKPWLAAGISRRKWYQLRKAERLDQVAVEAPVHCFVDTASAEPSCTVSWAPDPLTSLQKMSGQEEAQSVVPPVAVVEIPPAPEGGFVGQALTLDAAAVQRQAKRYPAIANDIRRHLDEIDGVMIRYLVADGDKLRVLRNNLADRNRLALRAARQAA